MSITPELGDHVLLNLQVVDDAYGVHADLYQDCLRVSTHATFREIQHAFLTKRRELMHQLEQGQDCHQQMDAVVLAVRILGDAELRARYDDMRIERMHRKRVITKNNNNDSSRIRSRVKRGNDPVQEPDTQFTHVNLVDTSLEDPELYHQDDAPRSIPRPPKRQARIVTPEPPVDDATLYTYDDETIDPTIDDMTILSGETHLVPRHRQTLLDRIANECMGALEDTSKSLEEVFSVFTLQDEEIDAVAKRINKAKRQMHWAL